jgi:hypothetical protein
MRTPELFAKPQATPAKPGQGFLLGLRLPDAGKLMSNVSGFLTDESFSRNPFIINVLQYERAPSWANQAEFFTDRLHWQGRNRLRD